MNALHGQGGETAFASRESGEDLVGLQHTSSNCADEEHLLRVCLHRRRLPQLLFTIGSTGLLALSCMFTTWGSPPTQTPVPTTAVTSDIQFVVNPSYQIGESVDFGIINNGSIEYTYFADEDAKCSSSISIFNESGRQIQLPRKCGFLSNLRLKPGTTVRLFRWDLSECLDEACSGTQLVSPGTYTIHGIWHNYITVRNSFVATADATLQVVSSADDER